jgi:hypothetical protein
MTVKPLWLLVDTKNSTPQTILQVKPLPACNIPFSFFFNAVIRLPFLIPVTDSLIIPGSQLRGAWPDSCLSGAVVAAAACSVCSLIAGKQTSRVRCQ